MRRNGVALNPLAAVVGGPSSSAQMAPIPATQATGPGQQFNQPPGQLFAAEFAGVSQEYLIAGGFAFLLLVLLLRR